MPEGKDNVGVKIYVTWSDDVITGKPQYLNNYSNTGGEISYLTYMSKNKDNDIVKM